MPIQSTWCFRRSTMTLHALPCLCLVASGNGARVMYQSDKAGPSPWRRVGGISF
jgi:hypothetical protein